MYIQPENIADLTTVKALDNSPYKFIVKRHTPEIEEALRDEITWRQITNYLNYIYATKMNRDTLYKHYQARKQARQEQGEAVANPQPITKEPAPQGAEMSLVDAIKIVMRHGGVVGWKYEGVATSIKRENALQRLSDAGYNKEEHPYPYQKMNAFFDAVDQA